MASTVDDEEYGLKFIEFPPHDPHPGKCPIVLQRHNGPCSFLALTNTLLLTRQITLPVRFTSLVPYSVLADLVASYILARHPEGAELESVLDILPKTRDGLDINPRFDSIGFAQSSQETGEMLLFKLAGVPLVHGFLADPADSETWKALSGITFDEAAMKVAQADELTGGLLLSEDGLDMDRLEQRRAAWSPEQSQQVHDGQLIQSFLQTNSGQLSYRGLFELATHLPPGTLAALFRSNHLSVLYRAHEDGDSARPRLYFLITDSSFQHEAMTWEGLTDIDGSSAFFDSRLRPVRSDATYARNALVQTQQEAVQTQQDDDPDHVLAMQIQREEYDQLHQRCRGAVQAPSSDASPSPNREGFPAPSRPPGRPTPSQTKKRCIMS